jgi:hypothetical protein
MWDRTWQLSRFVVLDAFMHLTSKTKGLKSIVATIVEQHFVL